MSDIFNILLEGGDVDHDGLEEHGFDSGGFGPDGASGLGRAGQGPADDRAEDGQPRGKKRRNRKVSTKGERSMEGPRLTLSRLSLACDLRA